MSHINPQLRSRDSSRYAALLVLLLLLASSADAATQLTDLSRYATPHGPAKLTTSSNMPYRRYCSCYSCLPLLLMLPTTSLTPHPCHAAPAGLILRAHLQAAHHRYGHDICRPWMCVLVGLCMKSWRRIVGHLPKAVEAVRLDRHTTAWPMSESTLPKPRLIRSLSLV